MQYIDLIMPVRILLMRVEIVTRNNQPGDPCSNLLSRADFPNTFRIQGKNDGDDRWRPNQRFGSGASGSVDEWPSFRRRSFDVDTENYYNRFRLRDENVGKNGQGRDDERNQWGFAVVHQLEYYGYLESDDGPSPSPSSSPSPSPSPSDATARDPTRDGFCDGGNVALWIYVVAILGALSAAGFFAMLILLKGSKKDPFF